MGGKRFTQEDAEYIRENIDKMRFSDIAQHLGRSTNSVIQFCLRNGIDKTVSFKRNEHNRNWMIENADRFSSRDEFYHAYMDEFGEIKYSTFMQYLYRIGIRELELQHWTDDRLNFIRENIDKMSLSQLSEIFGISKSGISHLCRRYGIKKHLYIRKRMDIPQLVDADSEST